MSTPLTTNRSEFSYLREQRTHALNEIQATLTALGVAMKDGADPRRWAGNHPWATAGTAFGLGLAAGYVVTPAKSTRGGEPHTSHRHPVPPPEPAAAAEPSSQNIDVEATNPLRDKLAAGAKSMVLGAAYGLGRLALNQILDGLLTGMHPPGDPDDQGPEHAADPHAESFSWQPETPA